MKRVPRKHIGVLCWVNADQGRRILTGALHYAETSGTCHVRIVHAGDPEGLPRWTANLDGLIVALPHDELWRTKKLDLPMVQATPFSDGRPMPAVSIDPCRAGQLAAEHLLSLRLRSFLFQKLDDPGNVLDELVAAFRSRVESVPGASVAQLETPTGDMSAADWMSTLPLPCGILSSRDTANIHRIFDRPSRHIPGQLAVMGIGDNVIKCMSAEPTLTSIALPVERMGSLAAELLCKVIDGVSVESVKLLPLGVIPRESTGTLATDDQIVLDAVAYIRENYSSPITASDVARAAGVSRNSLYEHFRKTLGTTVHEQLESIRLARASVMLASDNAPIKQIGLAVGIPDPANFSRFIKLHTGHPPRTYRQHLRRSEQGS